VRVGFVRCQSERPLQPHRRQPFSSLGGCFNLFALKARAADTSRTLAFEFNRWLLSTHRPLCDCSKSEDHREKKSPRGLMDKALLFAAKDCRLKSCQGHGPRKNRAPAKRARRESPRATRKTTERLSGEGGGLEIHGALPAGVRIPSLSSTPALPRNAATIEPRGPIALEAGLEPTTSSVGGRRLIH
jgi:hypothetical protein